MSNSLVVFHQSVGSSGAEFPFVQMLWHHFLDKNFILFPKEKETRFTVRLACRASFVDRLFHIKDIEIPYPSLWETCWLYGARSHGWSPDTPAPSPQTVLGRKQNHEPPDRLTNSWGSTHCCTSVPWRACLWSSRSWINQPNIWVSMNTSRKRRMVFDGVALRKPPRWKEQGTGEEEEEE